MVSIMPISTTRKSSAKSWQKELLQVCSEKLFGLVWQFFQGSTEETHGKPPERNSECGIRKRRSNSRAQLRSNPQQKTPDRRITAAIRRFKADGKRSIPPQDRRNLLCLVAQTLEADNAAHQREQGVVLADAHVLTGMNLGRRADEKQRRQPDRTDRRHASGQAWIRCRGRLRAEPIPLIS